MDSCLVGRPGNSEPQKLRFGQLVKEDIQTVAT
jgi:hypothetical protein